MILGISDESVLVDTTTTFAADKVWVFLVGDTARLSLVYKGKAGTATIKYGSFYEGVMYGSEETQSLNGEGIRELAAGPIACRHIQITVPASSVVDFLALESV